MVEFADHTGKSIRLLYYPALSQQIRSGGALPGNPGKALWNGAKLTDAQTMLEWAKSMTWKGVHPVVELSRTVYQKGITVVKAAMQSVESRRERNPLLPKWDISIRPA